jgi:hypothetical protein
LSVETEGWFVYDGYDPKVSLLIMEKIEPDKMALMSDIKICAYFVMHRGNKPIKAMQKMDDDGKNLLNKLITKYNIIQSIPKSKNDLTMLRIAGICPLFCAQISANPNTKT